MKKSKLLLNLFWTFFKIGIFTFGGGYALVAMIEEICVEKKEWITHDEMMNVTVIAESTPGPIAINCATYVGYKQAGFVGSLISTFGIVLPAFAIIFVISIFFNNFLEIKIIESAFKGIKVAVGVVILSAGITMIKKMKKKPYPIAIVVISFIAMTLVNIFSWNFSSISLMIIAAIVSLVVFFITNAIKKGGEAK